MVTLRAFPISKCILKLFGVYKHAQFETQLNNLYIFFVPTFFLNAN